MEPWVPLQQYPQNPEYVRLAIEAGTRPPAAVFGNDIYQVAVYVVGDKPPGEAPIHLSIKREDRLPIHDWRHLQAIKNEIVGPESLAVEIYPQESKLVDSANQYHLWVLPKKVRLPFGFDEFLVSSDYQVDLFNAGREAGKHKGRQRPFQPNLPVALTRNKQDGAGEDMADGVYMQPAMRQRIPE
jgi:hypothetical protein